jgi:RNA polymerase sigma-70 factor, ECF subfamily
MFFFFESPRSYELKPDELVLAQSLQNPRVFSILVSRYEAMFVRKARQILKDDEEARDAVQDTFVKVYAHASRFRELDGGSFKSWAFKILMNTCFTRYADAKKRRLRSVSIERELVSEPRAEAESIHSTVYLNRDALSRAIDALPEPMGKILSLHYLEEKPQKEIAALLHVSPETVRVRIHRAKKELKKITKANE